MLMTVRWSVLGILLIVLLGVWTQPDVFDRWGLNIGGMSEWREKEQRFMQRRDAVARENQALRDRIVAKGEVTRELLAGRITLLQAARRFRDLNDSPIAYPSMFWRRYPGRSDGEKLCREVLRWVEAYLKDLPGSQSPIRLRQLEQELAENLRRNGGVVVLP
jgi:hypothetical protein